MKEIQKAVEAVRNDKEKEVAYMTYAQKMEDVRWESRKEALVEGEELGKEKLGLLMSKLFAASRFDDAIAASTDKEKREQLLKEFGIQ